LLTDDDAFHRMSRDALRTFEEKFSPGVMLKATERIYQAAMLSRAQRSSRLAEVAV
jgi:hypothetical protein